MSLVVIENISTQAKIKLDSLKKLARKILKDFGEKGGVNIILVPDKFMRKLNQKFTKRKGTTDVLSFNFREIRSPNFKEAFLGEVYISVDKARRQAKEYKTSLNQELRRLLTHGVLHLLGYEHQIKKDEEKMKRKEREYLFFRRRSKR